MREIVLDTETTGLDPTTHRIVEIGCLELINHVSSGRNFQRYLNPERDMPPDAFDVHGLSDEFLSDKPLFADVVDAFFDFIGDSQLVIHNARFDIGFINAELDRIDRPGLEISRSIDTVELARRKQPGAPANLDALCRRFGIDNSGRKNSMSMQGLSTRLTIRSGVSKMVDISVQRPRGCRAAQYTCRQNQADLSGAEETRHRA